MEEDLKSALAERPRNAIGALRLLFASLVIAAHSPEMLDGNKGRELLHHLTGTTTLGGLAVDAFFLLSGYLIAASFAASSSLVSYAVKRILRIVPAFVVCSLVCVLIVAPLAGAHIAHLGLRTWAGVLVRMVTLKAPEIPGTFTGTPYAALNGSAWTISYEFRCYILAAVFGLLGFYRPRTRPAFLALAALVLLGTVAFSTSIGETLRAPGWFVSLVGDPIQAVRLLAAFVVGTCFWLYRDKVVYRWPLAAASAAIGFGLLFVPALAEAGLIVFGGYALFCVSFHARWKPLHTINARDDISYGVYLYAWPIAALLIWYWRDIPVLALGLLTLLGALACGAASWFAIEKPAMALKRHVSLQRYLPRPG